MTDRKLSALIPEKMRNWSLLYRGATLVKREAFIGPPVPCVHITHLEPHIIYNGDVHPKTIGIFMEVFKLNANFHCENCNSWFYNSTNFMEGPEWFVRSSACQGAGEGEHVHV